MTVILLLLSTVGFSQITAEIVDSQGERTIRHNDTASVLIEVYSDWILIHSNGLVSRYKVESFDEAICSEEVPEGTPCPVSSRQINIKDGHKGLSTITLWSDGLLVIFKYEDGSYVANSGVGITYRIAQ